MNQTIKISSQSANSFNQRVLTWFHQKGRKNLPWQYNKTPYRVWISEIMLQQTQVSTVIPYYQRFMESFPSIADLANADEDNVLHHWTGLGYYARARNLHKAAKMIVNDFSGEFPQTLEETVSLPGIGRSTAGAILSIALNKHQAILDGNVKRVLARYYTVEGHNGQAIFEKTLWPVAEKLTPEKDVASYTQAMMDLGATVCTRSKPACNDCPVQSSCLAYAGSLQTEFPNKKPKKTIPTKNTIMVIPRINQQVLMEKRPPTGIWGGLWCFYEVSHQDELDTLFTQLGLKPQDPIWLEEFRHTFSHYHLDITPVVIDCYQKQAQEIQQKPQQQWYDLQSQANVGLAASTLKLIKLLS
jgi:A/G-specific adenine glycosylase